MEGTFIFLKPYIFFPWVSEDKPLHWCADTDYLTGYHQISIIRIMGCQSLLDSVADPNVLFWKISIIIRVKLQGNDCRWHRRYGGRRDGSDGLHYKLVFNRPSPPPSCLELNLTAKRRWTETTQQKERAHLALALCVAQVKLLQADHRTHTWGLLSSKVPLQGSRRSELCSDLRGRPFVLCDNLKSVRHVYFYYLYLT